MLKQIKNHLDKSKFLKDFLATFGSNISILLVGIISSIITVRYLKPEGMGTYTILTTFALFFVSLAELGIRQSNVYIISRKENSLNEILGANYILWIISSLIGIIIFSSITFFQELDMPLYLLLVAGLIIPINIANKFLNGIMIGKDNISKNSKINFINGITKLVLVILFIVLLKLNVLGALLVLIIPVLTNMVRKFIFLHKKYEVKLKFEVNIPLIKTLISHGLLYGIALFLMTNQKQIPILVMSGIIDEKQIGIYGIGLTFAGLVYQIFSAAAPVIFVKSANANNAVDASEKIQKLMRVMFITLIIVGVFISIFIKYILLLMYGVDFIESANVTRIMLLGIIFYNIFLVLNMDMAGKGKPWLAIYALIPVSAINFILNYLFIEEFGIIGAAGSTSLSMAIASIIYLFLYSKAINTSILEIISPKKSDWDFLNKLKSIGKS